MTAENNVEVPGQRGGNSNQKKDMNDILGKAVVNYRSGEGRQVDEFFNGDTIVMAGGSQNQGRTVYSVKANDWQEFQQQMRDDVTRAADRLVEQNATKVQLQGNTVATLGQNADAQSTGKQEEKSIGFWGRLFGGRRA